MVKHSKMIECLKEIGLDGKDLLVITNLYWDQTATVRTESGVPNEFEIKKGVQKVVCYHLVFSTYTLKGYLRMWRI